MQSAAATFPRVTAVQARAVAYPDYRRIFSDVALGLGSMTAVAAMVGTATVTAAWLVASSFAHDPDLRPAAPTVLDMARLPKPHLHLASAAERFGSALAAANPVYARPPMRTAELTPSDASASSPVPMPKPKPIPAPAPHLPPQRTAALEHTIPLPQPRPAGMAYSPVAHKAATPASHVARVLTVLPTPRPVDNSQRTEPELARISALPAAAPTIASIIAATAPDVRQPPRQHELIRLSAPAAAPQTTFSTPERAETTSASQPANPVQHRHAQLAYNNPDLPSGPDSHTAIYDIVAHTVYLPNGERLEAHSGLGRLLDDPRYVSEKSRGATPPNVYDLTLRHPLFHGVQAIRLNPVGDTKMYGRAGILAHTYMLGPSGQSFGCVSFKNYAEFLHAFLRGEIDKLVVVPRLRTAPWAERARRADGKRYAFNAQ
jgi:hypothetical protein